MNARKPNSAPAAEAAPYSPGVSWYQVMEPTKLLDPTGNAQMQVTGPFPDLASASMFAQSRPGSMIVVSLILFQAPPLQMIQKPAPN